MLALAAEILRGVPDAAAEDRQRSIPAALEAICLKAMAKDPVGRYVTAGELAAALHKS